jgi:hypothetical protein
VDSVKVRGACSPVQHCAVSGEGGLYTGWRTKKKPCFSASVSNSFI